MAFVDVSLCQNQCARRPTHQAHAVRQTRWLQALLRVVQTLANFAQHGIVADKAVAKLNLAVAPYRVRVHGAYGAQDFEARVFSVDDELSRSFGRLNQHDGKLCAYRTSDKPLVSVDDPAACRGHSSGY